jgi:hypothetical protein
MTCWELLKKVQDVGGVLALDGNLVFYDLPEDAVQLVDELHSHRDELRRILHQRIAASVKRWLAKHCVTDPSDCTPQKFLYRGFVDSTGLGCSESSFIEEIRQNGFEADADGWITGLVLREDFLADRQYERERRPDLRIH